MNIIKKLAAVAALVVAALGVLAPSATASTPPGASAPHFQPNSWDWA
ncbi:MAG: hypothetical protein ABI131_00710 [Nostocoides sp.]